MLFQYYYKFGSLFTVIIGLFVGLFVFYKNRKSVINITWALLSLSIAIWSFSTFMMTFSRDSLEAYFWGRLLHVGAIAIPVFFFHFSIATLGIKKKRLLILAYLAAVMLLYSSLATPLIISGVTAKLTFKYYPDPGPLYVLFLIIFISLPIYSLMLMLKEYKKALGYKKNQLRYLIIASIIGFSGGATNYPLIFNIPLYPIGHPLVAFYAIIITYAIARYRLMDISVAITRTGIFVAVYTLVLGLPFTLAIWFKGWLIDLLGLHWWILPLGLMAALATVGPFVYIYLDRKAEERLLKEQRRYQEVLKQASMGMTRIRNLRKLLDLIAHIVTKTVKISYVAVYLYNNEIDEYVLQIARDKNRISIPKLTPENELVSWIVLKREPLVYDEVKRQMEDAGDPVYKKLEENMRLLTAAVVIPSFLEDRFMGFIVLGDKVSGRIYTPEDLNVFQVLASQAALAIENAQFYEEAKEMHEQIAQAEKMATIGTMADGLSHQISNRFHALSLIAGDTIDTIKMMDTSKCSPEVKEMITQVNHALKRIQTNVIQGGEVVRGLLKYSRRSDASFEAIALNTILDNTLEMVQYKIKLSEIDIIRNFDHDTPKIKGNTTQLEEVFFNFIDNAYDAIGERRGLLKEEGYRGKINIFAKPKTDDILEIIVQDNGIGIKNEDGKKVFTPFFTTKTSSHKGTGLGLYVIKRIINDSHKGKISFESDYKVGTRFILELPIART